MKFPGADAKISYKVVAYQGDSKNEEIWAVEQTERKTIAWFNDRAQAISVCNSLLPINASRET
jgi:hypothetical protein